MERSGPSIEVKVVLLVGAALVLQDLVLFAMYAGGARPGMIQLALGGVLALSLVAAAVWGNTLVRAVRRLVRACYVARHGDTGVLSELTRMDELGQLNDEINRLVVLLRDSTDTRSELTSSKDVIEELERTAPEIMRSSHELLVSLKELREGAAAEIAILRKVAGCLGEARGLVGDVARGTSGSRPSNDAAARLKSLGSLARETELLADAVVDEVARPSIDEASLARAVNGLRDAARTMAEIAAQAIGPLEKREEDAEAALKAADRIITAETEKADGSRVAELMERSARNGLAEATRLATALRKLGVVLEAYAARRRARRG
jgi:methyl-accepting chemotaxis protein